LRGSRIFAAVALLCATPAAGQNVADAPTGCEFHVWPGDGLMSTYYGWFHDGIVNGQVEGRPGYPAIPPNPIDTAMQASLLAETHPEAAMRQADYRLIVHREALSSRVIRQAHERLAHSSSSCYAELIVDDVILQTDWVNGSSLHILFHYRDFGPDPLPRRVFATWVETHLSTFPPRQPDQLDAAIAEIRQAYRDDVALFATALNRPPRHH
jgi:hypothetical protein